MNSTENTTVHHFDADHVIARIAGIGTEYLVVVRPLSDYVYDVLLAGGPDRTYGRIVARGIATMPEAIAAAANLATAELAGEIGEPQQQLHVAPATPEFVDDLMFTCPSAATDELRRLAADRSTFAAGCERSSEGLFALLVGATRIYAETTEAQAGRVPAAGSFAVECALQAVAENLEA